MGSGGRSVKSKVTRTMQVDCTHNLKYIVEIQNKKVKLATGELSFMRLFPCVPQ